MKSGYSARHIVWAVLLSCLYVLGLAGCGGDSGPTPGGLSITTTSLPEVTVNHPYSASLGGSGGALPYTWSVTPALPPQSLVGCGDRRHHRHPDDGGNHDTHVYTARQLGPFANRPTDAQLDRRAAALDHHNLPSRRKYRRGL